MPTSVLPWPKGKAKRVSVSCYGYGGANFHVILETLEEYIRSKPALFPKPPRVSKKYLVPYSAPQQPPEIPSPSPCKTPKGETPEVVGNRPFLFTFSAKTETNIKSFVSNLSNYILATPAASDRLENIADLAYTLTARRSILPVKAYGVFVNRTSITELGAELQKLSQQLETYPEPQEETRIGFVFTGQGAQWAQMGVSLRSTFPVVEKTLQKLEGVLSGLPDAPEWSLGDELSKSKEDSRINEPQFSQVLCTAVQIALVDLFRSWNIKPRAVVGHSSGEIAAAYASGALKAEDAIVVAYYRGKVCGAAATMPVVNKPNGGMLSVGLGQEDIAEYLKPFEGKLLVGCVNSPKNVTVSGDADAIESLQKTLEAANSENPIFNRRLKVPLAYHSHHMAAIGEQYQTLLDTYGISTKVGFCPIFSSVTAEVVHGKKVGGNYWRRNLESPVQFSDAVQKLIKEASVNTLIEIGPHSALSSPIREIGAAMKLGRDQLSYVPTLIRGQDCAVSVLEMAGKLFCKGYTAVDLAQVNAVENLQASGEVVRQAPSVVVDIPNYAWDHSNEYWFESRRSKEWRSREHPKHDLLGSKVTGTDLAEWQWMNVISANTTVWLKDHRLRGSAVMPAVGYVAMAIEALTQILETRGLYNPDNAFYLREVSIKKPLLLDDRPLGATGTEVYTTMRPGQVNSLDQSKYYEFNIRSSGGDGQPVTHCSGVICSDKRKPLMEKPSKDGVKLREVDSEKLYKAMAAAGFDHEKRFKAMKRLRTQNDGNIMWAEMLNHNLQEAWTDEEERTEDTKAKSENETAGAGSTGWMSPEVPPSPKAMSSGSSTPRSIDSAFSAPSSLSSIDPSTDKDEPPKGQTTSTQDFVVQTPFFKALRYPTETKISADGTTGHIDSRYPVHPINLDMPMQLIFTTIHNGRLSIIDDIVVPVFIEEMYVASPASEASPMFEMYCKIRHLDKITFGESECAVYDSTGQEVIRISQVRGMEVGAALQAGRSKKETDHFRLEWVVDWDFVDEDNFERVVEQSLPVDVRRRAKPDEDFFARQNFIRLLAAEMLQLMTDVEIPDEGPSVHFRKYGDWLRSILTDEANVLLNFQNNTDPRMMHSSERQKTIESFISSVTSITPEVNLAYKIYKNIVPLAQGSISAFDLLSEDGLLQSFNSGERHIQTSVAKLYSQKYAKADVLQIGGGYGGATQAILKGMTTDAGSGVMEKCYGSFMWTDSEAANVKKAKDRFCGYSGMEFATLNIGGNLVEQGFEKAFDIIYALNVSPRENLLCRFFTNHMV